MAESAREIMDALPPRSFAPNLRGVRGSFRIDVGEIGSVHLTVEDGAIVTRRDRAEADCVVECSEADFGPIMRGEKRMITAAMRHEIRVRGNPMLALKLQEAVRATMAAPPPAAPRKAEPPRPRTGGRSEKKGEAT
jgi:putative sterol carrier protein